MIKNDLNWYMKAGHPKHSYNLKLAFVKRVTISANVTALSSVLTLFCIKAKKKKKIRPWMELKEKKDKNAFLEARIAS